MGLTRRVADRLSTRATPPVGWVGSSTVSPGAWGALSVDANESRWTASATAYRCVQAISANAASLRLQVRDPDGATIEGHWLGELWERPNPILSRRVLAELIWAKLETRGVMYLYADRGESGTGTPKALWPIWGDVLPVVAGRDNGRDKIERDVIGYQVRLPGREPIGLLPEEVLHLRYPSVSDEVGHVAPLAAAGHAIEMDAYARAWQHGEFKNGAAPKHVVYLGDLSREAHAQAVENYRSTVQGAHNAGKSLLVSGPNAAKVERLTMSPSEMSWLDTRGVNSQEVMLAFGVPKDYLLGGATYENRAASRATLWSDTIIPKLELVASEITRQLLDREAPRRARFDTDSVDALQEGSDAKAKRATDLTAHDVLLIDEARAEMGLDPLPDGLGAFTLTAYRMRLQLESQAALLAVTGDRALRSPAIGRSEGNVASTPLLLPSGVRVHGPSKTKILAEYDRHERIVAKAVARLAARQQAVTLTNAERLFGAKSSKAAAWHRSTQAAVVAHFAAEPDSDERAAAAALVRAKMDDLFDGKHWRAETKRDLESSVGGAWQAGGSSLASSLGIDFDLLDPIVNEKIEARLEVLAAQVTDTTRDVLESKVLLEAVEQGESIEQIKTRIRGVFSGLSSYRAETIARTEVVGGFNAASLTVAEESGVVVERQWLATGDDRVRDSHVEQDGAIVRGFKDRYANGCLHPGDASGPPEETINCRCVELYVTKD